jgi:hypothetical protein
VALVVCVSVWVVHMYMRMILYVLRKRKRKRRWRKILMTESGGRKGIVRGAQSRREVEMDLEMVGMMVVLMSHTVHGSDVPRTTPGYPAVIKQRL